MSIHVHSAFAWLAVAAAASGLALAPAGNATPVTYAFSVHVDSGPLKGVDESGTFSYDSSIAAPDALLYRTGLLSGFDFSFNGISYDVTNVDTGWLGFDASGNLEIFVMGNACYPSAICGITAGQDTWWIREFEVAYSAAGFSNFGYGTITWSKVAASVDEPGTIGLFGVGLLLLAGAVARRRLASAAPASTAT